MNNNIPTFSKLTKNQKKVIFLLLEEEYGVPSNFLKKTFLYINAKGKVHLTTFDIDKEYNQRVNSVGIYFGTFHDERRFRFSLEGSQMFEGQKNFIILKDEKALQSYLAAENLFDEDIKETNITGTCPFLIVKYKTYNLGCVSKKDTYYLNYLPKSRKLDFNKVF